MSDIEKRIWLNFVALRTDLGQDNVVRGDVRFLGQQLNFL